MRAVATRPTPNTSVSSITSANPSPWSACWRASRRASPAKPPKRGRSRMPSSWTGERPRPEALTAIAEAASVVLERIPAAAVPEVYVVRRSDQLRFFGGYHAFPGGRLAPEDAEVPVAGVASAVDPRRAAAARELFEETGVLVARRADGSFP